MDITGVPVDQIRVVGALDRLFFSIGDHPPLVMTHLQAGYLLALAFAAGSRAVEARRGVEAAERRPEEER